MSDHARATPSSSTMKENATRSASARTRSALTGFSGYGSRMSMIPASANTSASPSFAQQIPTAPRAICISATSGDLWVLAWGRSRRPRAVTAACIRSRLRFRRDDSISTAGVCRSSMRIGWFHHVIGCLRIAAAGLFFNNELDRVSLVLIEKIVDGAGSGGTDAHRRPASAAVLIRGHADDDQKDHDHRRPDDQWRGFSVHDVPRTPYTI